MDLIFVTHPNVEFGGNTFVSTPVILQYEDTRLIEVVDQVGAGFTAQFDIYHPDGTKIAKVKNTQLYHTESGRLADLKLRHEPQLTACELDGNTLFEVRRTGPAALKMSAELYCPNGAFVVVTDTANGVYRVESDGEKTALQVGGITMSGNVFQSRVGVWIFENGACLIGSSGIRPPHFSRNDSSTPTPTQSGTR